MDRFIACFVYDNKGLCFDLKSNMDRFIVTMLSPLGVTYNNLKSNMDRFIASIQRDRAFAELVFKIQYG